MFSFVPKFHFTCRSNTTIVNSSAMYHIYQLILAGVTPLQDSRWVKVFSFPPVNPVSSAYFGMQPDCWLSSWKYSRCCQERSGGSQESPKFKEMIALYIFLSSVKCLFETVCIPFFFVVQILILRKLTRRPPVFLFNYIFQCEFVCLHMEHVSWCLFLKSRRECWISWSCRCMWLWVTQLVCRN